VAAAMAVCPVGENGHDSHRGSLSQIHIVRIDIRRGGWNLLTVEQWVVFAVKMVVISEPRK
jgi:hypothetical protein